MRKLCAVLVTGLFMNAGLALAAICPVDTISLVDIHNATGSNGVSIGTNPISVLSLDSPRQRGSYNLLEGRISASAELFAFYMDWSAKAHAGVVVRDVYTLVGPSSPDPIAFTARLSVTARGAGEVYYQCLADLCKVPAGSASATIREGATNASSYLHTAQGSDTSQISVTIERVAGQTFELRLSCSANADFAGNPFLDQDSNRSAEVTALLTFPDLPAGYRVVSCQGYLGRGETPVTTANGDQTYPAVASDGAGGAIVVWHDALTNEVRGQRIDAQGSPRWAAPGVTIGGNATGYERAISIVSDGAGGGLVGWGNGSQVFVQRVSAEGVTQWTAGGVVLTNVEIGAFLPTVIADGTGGVIAAWPQYSDGAWSLHAQRVDAVGVARWAPHSVLLSSTSMSMQYLAMASDGAGGAIVAWHDGRSGTGFDIYAQRVGAHGVVKWAADGVPLCTAANEQMLPSIASDRMGGAIVAWQDARGGSTNLYGQRVDSAGTPQWTFNGVALAAATWTERNVTIVPDGQGGAIASWIEDRSVSPNIRAQRINGSGTSLWPAEGVVLSSIYSGSPMAVPLVCIPDGAGGAVVTWVVGGGGAFDIGAQQVDAAGTTRWTGAGLALCAAADEQLYPAIAADGLGSAIVAWQDRRSGTNWDIYAQWLSPGQTDKAAPTVHVVRPDGGEDAYLGEPLVIVWEAWDDVGVQSVDVYLSRGGPSGPWEPLASGLPNTGSYVWTAAGLPSNFAAYVRVDARDAAGGIGTDQSDAGFSISSGPVPTLVELFRLEDTVDGVVIHWSIADPVSIGSITPQRSASRSKGWSDVPGVPTPQGRVYELIDHAAMEGVMNWYRLVGVLRDGRQFYEPPLSIVHAGVTAFALDPVVPNPVVGSAQVTYALPRRTGVHLSMVDVQGREVARLVDAEREAGQHVARLDVHDLRAGLYFLRLRAAGMESRQRLIVVR